MSRKRRKRNKSQKRFQARPAVQKAAARRGRLKGEQNLKITAIDGKPIGMSRFSNRYLEYLESPEWRRIRSKRLKKDGHKCQACGSTEILQVHHRTYKRLFHEHLSDLITLCKKCHMALHQRKRKTA